MDWSFAWSILPELLRGLVVTVEVTLIGIVLAMVLGLFLALARRSRRWYLQYPVRGLIEFVRSTPLLVQLYFLFFVAPLVLGLRMSAFVTGILVLGIHYATYTSEVYRAGIDAVPRGQWEAATALSFPRAATWRRVILPQAIPPVIPALGNYLISMFKDTPQLLAIGVLEILTRAQRIGARSFQYDEAYTLAGVIFLVLAYGSSIFVRYMERRFGSVGGAPI